MEGSMKKWLFLLLFACAGWSDQKCPPEDKCFWQKQCDLNKKKEETPPQPPVKSSPPASNSMEKTSESSALIEKYWHYHHWGAVGYRYDRQKFNEFGSSHQSNSQTRLHGRNSATLKVGTHIEFKNWVLGMHGEYGWMIDGHYDFKRQASGSEPFSYQFNLGSGYTALLQGQLGYEWKWVKNKKFGFGVIPAAGYRYSHIMNWPKEEKQFGFPTPPLFNPVGSTGFALGEYPKPSQQDWFGPFLEGRVRFYFWEKGQCDFYYQYQWVNLRVKSTFDVNSFLYNPASTLVSATRVRYSSLINDNYTGNQLGGVDIRIHLESGWTFGLFFEGSKASTQDATQHLKTTTETDFPAPIQTTVSRTSAKESVLWVIYDLSLLMGYKF